MERYLVADAQAQSDHPAGQALHRASCHERRNLFKKKSSKVSAILTGYSVGAVQSKREKRICNQHSKAILAERSQNHQYFQ
jgi:hypothetical protein